jgi:prepilin-type processing-associated H-X9-DG protein
LLVVIGIIAVLIGLLLPVMSEAQAQARWVNCQSNLRQIGFALEMYSHNWKGWIYPPQLGANRVPDERWPVHVFKPAVWDPPVMTCPNDYEPREKHSYILNDHLYLHGIKFSTKRLGGLTASDVIVMGEKRSDWEDYYMNKGDYPSRVEPYRHGLKRGSNYLFLDLHVGTLLNRKHVLRGVDPWDPPVDEPTAGNN